MRRPHVYHFAPFFTSPGRASLTPTSAPAASSPAALLAELYAVATAAVDPGPALAGRLRSLGPADAARPWLIALGKAAQPMARAAVAALAARGLEPAGGLVISPQGDSP
ncbi:MAG: hypothetical protein H0T50_09865, partial [Gemmatimonadales bacterium]|nr:hypothetical protein [Gemmatimonadales bacterium]